MFYPGQVLGDARCGKLILFAFLAGIAVRTQLSATDIGVDVFYTQYGFQLSVPTVGKVHAEFSFGANTLTLTGNTVLLSRATNASFNGADGIVLNPNNGNLLIGSGGLGSSTVQGKVFQVTPNGTIPAPFSASPDGAGGIADPRAYALVIVPANGGTSGFPAGSLLALPKDFGTAYISILPLTPSLADGKAYPVTGDDLFITGIAFSANGTAYYGSGTETSTAGNFGTITFDGNQFLTHRLFGKPVNADARGGIVYTGTHRLSFDPFTGDIFMAGGNTIGQYDPAANTFHILPVSGPANGYQFIDVINDGQGHAFVTAGSGGTGDSQNGAGDLVVIDYSTAPNHVLDAPAGVQYARTFLAPELASIAFGNLGPPPPPDTTPPTVTLTAPVNGATVSASVAIAAVASDNVGVAGVQFAVDGANLGTPVTAAPYSAAWDSTTAANGPHTITATAFDAAGNHASASVSVTVSNAIPPPVFNPIRVRSGGLAYTDSQGQLWSADFGYSGNTAAFTVPAPIAGTSDAPLYQSERYAYPGPLTYSFPVPGGSYVVTLKFAENYATGAGQRVFNIVINGQTVESNFDIFAQAGGAGRAIDQQFTIAASTAVTIQLVPVIGAPKVNAISIEQPGSPLPPAVGMTLTPVVLTLTASQTQQFTATVTGSADTSVIWLLSPNAPGTLVNGLYTAPPFIAAPQTVIVTAISHASPSAVITATITLQPSSPPPPTSANAVRVRAGGGAYTDSQGNVWSGDFGYSGNTGAITIPDAISGTNDQPLYQSERYAYPGTLEYTLPVPPGSYTLTLKFAENYVTAAGQRVFDIVVNGQTLLASFDIFAEAGASTAVDKSFPIVSNGTVVIQLVAVVGGPKVNAIAIF